MCIHLDTNPGWSALFQDILTCKNQTKMAYEAMAHPVFYPVNPTATMDASQKECGPIPLYVNQYKVMELQLNLSHKWVF